jgi:hypothetical protein
MARTRTKLAAACVSLALAAVTAEAVVRILGGYRLQDLSLTRPFTKGPAVEKDLLGNIDDLTKPLLATLGNGRADLIPAWLSTSPPPLPSPKKLAGPLLPQRDWLLHYYVLNEVLLRAMWQKGTGLPMLAGLVLPAQFQTFAPPSGSKTPRYRYPTSCTLPTGLCTNSFGFRGRELSATKPARTVRIGFVGASTTVEAHGIPFSAPELIEHWLMLWAKKNGLDVQFETLNAAREAIQSSDIRAIVQDELLPLDVDLVVYYEGANQLQPATMQRHVQVNESFTLAEPPDGVVGTFDDAVAATSLLDRLALYSALAERLRNALRSSGAQPEPQKPAQQVTLPGFLADNDFPLARANEVLECEAIKQDLDAIRLALAEQGKAFALCSFAWLAHDFMTTDPVLGRNIFIQLNRAYWPFRYATVRTLADAQNQFFRAWAKANGAQLIDIAALLPMDQRLYIDAIHHTELGVRLKAWVMFVQLTQWLERELAAAKLPSPPTKRPAPLFHAVQTITPAQLDAGR